MSQTLKVEIDIKPAIEALHRLPPSAMTNAWRRALRKTGVWIKSQTAKAVSREARIPQKLLRQRLYYFLRSRDTGKVWLGLNALAADRLGTPRQTRTGVTVARHQFKSAWIYRTNHNNAADGNTGKVFQRVGRKRLPYERVKVDWDQAGAAAFHEAAARAEERLLVILRQEVSYELQKAIRGAQ